MDRTGTNGCTERTIENRQVFFGQLRGPFDAFPIINMGQNSGDLLRVLAKLLQRHGDRVIDDLEEASADQLLILHQGDIRLHTGRVAIHHE